MTADKPHWREVDHQGLTVEHKLAVAECVMAWGKCESNLRALLTALEGRHLDDGAKDYNRLTPNDAWKRIKKQMRKSGAKEPVLNAIQKQRDGCRMHYETRRIIVHSGCVGVWTKDRDYLAFSAFETFAEGEMALYWLPINDLLLSTHYAEGAKVLSLRILKELGH